MAGVVPLRLRLIQAAAPLSFPSISGMNLHITAAGLPDNTAVATVADTSGSGNDLTQATGGLRPVSFTSLDSEAKPYIYFAQDVIENTGYSIDKRAATFFWVGTLQTLDNNQYLMDIGALSSVIMNDNGPLKVYTPTTTAGRVFSGRRFAFVYVLDASGRTLYLDDVASTTSVAAMSAGSVSKIQVSSSMGTMTGRVYEFAAWDRALNSTEAGQLLSYSADTGNWGTGLTQLTPTGRVVFDGDSTTFGTGATRGRSLAYYLDIDPAWYPYSFGLTGQTLATMATDQSEVNDAFYADSTNWLIIEAGYNDLAASATGVTVEGRLRTYCEAAITAGYSKSNIVVMTLSTSTAPTERDAANTLIRSNYTDYAGWLVDQAADSQVGVNVGLITFQTPANFADGVHKNDAGYAAQAALVRSTIGGSLPW